QPVWHTVLATLPKILRGRIAIENQLRTVGRHIGRIIPVIVERQRVVATGGDLDLVQPAMAVAPRGGDYEPTIGRKRCGPTGSLIVCELRDLPAAVDDEHVTTRERAAEDRSAREHNVLSRAITAHRGHRLIRWQTRELATTPIGREQHEARLLLLHDVCNR